MFVNERIIWKIAEKLSRKLRFFRITVVHVGHGLDCDSKISIAGCLLTKQVNCGEAAEA